LQKCDALQSHAFKVNLAFGPMAHGWTAGAVQPGMKAWPRLFAGEIHVLETALPADQCSQRLSGRIAYGSMGVAEQQWSAVGMSDAFSADALARQPLRGSVNSTGFQVAKRVAIGVPPQLAMVRMLFETWARGTFVSQQGGTRVIVRLGGPRGLGCLWLGIANVAFFLALGVVGNAFSSWSVLAIPGAFAGVILLSRLAAWNDVDDLVNIISTTLQAKEARAA
jgi:hypothetical protein